MTEKIETILYPEYLAQIRLRFPLNGVIVSPTGPKETLILRQVGAKTPELGHAIRESDGYWRAYNGRNARAGKDAYPDIYDDAGIIAFLAEDFIRYAPLSGHQTIEIAAFLAHTDPVLAPRASNDQILHKAIYRKTPPPTTDACRKPPDGDTALVLTSVNGCVQWNTDPESSPSR